MEYTEAVHASMLLRILSMENPCGKCPANVFGCLFETWGGIHDKCDICYKFLSLRYDPACPCHYLGKQECIKRTWIALEEKGYLD
jgi:hypothetical protein